MTGGLGGRLAPNAGTGTDSSYATIKGVAIGASAGHWLDQTIPHAVLLYRRKFQTRVFEMKDHKELGDGPARPGFVWIEPNIPPERMRLVVSRARLVYDSHQKNRVPYGFGFKTSSFDEKGGYRLGTGEIGFTCATIVVAIFHAEGVPLIDPTTWPPPDGTDVKAREGFLKRLRAKDPEHATVLEKDLRSPRISPEEVVAAGALHPTVGTFENVQEGAAEVRQRLGT